MRRRLGSLTLLLAAAVAIAPAASAAAAEPSARLSLFKAIENLDTGSGLGDRTLWTMHAVNTLTGEEFSGDGLNGVQSRLVPPGSYRIFETGGVPGYAFYSWNCGGSVTTQPERVITLAVDQNLTCTVENRAIKPTLSLVKNVVGGTAPPSEWTLQAQGPTNIQGPGGSAAVTNQPARIGTYTLSESEGPNGYTAGDWTCAARDVTTGAVTSLPVTGGTVKIDLGMAVTCSITNSAGLPLLTLVKQVLNPFPGSPAVAAPEDFTLSASGPTPISGPSGDDSVTFAGVDPGAYALGETGPDGYTGGAWACQDAGGPLDQTGSTVTLGATSNVTCTITNSFVGGWLSLVKVVEGSDQPPSDWTLTAAGPITLTGPAGSQPVTQVPVPTGAYVLSESGGGADYTSSGWSCPGGGLAGDVVTVTAGAQIVCTITNTLALAQLTLQKNVINRGGGPLTPDDWTLTAESAGRTVTGPHGSPGTRFTTVEPGTYTLSESSTAPEAEGYTSEGWVCLNDDDIVMNVGDQVTVAANDSVTCTVTNRWQGATLTLAKAVAAPAGSPSPPTAWTLGATDGVGTITGVMGDTSITRAPVAPGAWTLSETGGPSGYEALGWACSGAAWSDDVVTITPGTDVFCTATNAAILPTLTLVKQVDNAGRGRAVPGDFELKSRGPGNAALSGPTGSSLVTAFMIPPGDYIFSEDGPGGYTSELTCAGADAWDGTEALLDYGQNVVCTFTNTFVGATLTLVNEVQGDPDAGPAAATDWQLRAVGAPPFPRPQIQGVTGSLDVTTAPLPSGSFRLGSAALPSTPTADYTTLAWTCDGGELVDDIVTLADGDDVTCTIVQRYRAPDPDTDNGGGTDLAASGLAVPPVATAAVGVMLAIAGMLIALRDRRRRSER